MREIGKTTLGKPLIAAFISAPENIRNLDRYRQIKRSLPILARLSKVNLKRSSEPARRSYRSRARSIRPRLRRRDIMTVNRKTANEKKKILEFDHHPAYPVSESGRHHIANWYRKTLGTKSEGNIAARALPPLRRSRQQPRLVHAESRGDTSDHKAVLAGMVPADRLRRPSDGTERSEVCHPPFFDPPNPRIPPSILREVGLVGYKMAADQGEEHRRRCDEHDLRYVVARRISAPYFHNSIGILSEAASADRCRPSRSSQRTDAARAPLVV